MALELTDAQLGAEVRQIIEQYPEQFDNDVMCCTALAIILAGTAYKLGGKLDLKIPELFHKNKNVGAWRVVATKDGVTYDDEEEE